jgi:hypothetical protein
MPIANCPLKNSALFIYWPYPLRFHRRANGGGSTEHVAFRKIPGHATGFAEPPADMPERHWIELYTITKKRSKVIYENRTDL